MPKKKQEIDYTAMKKPELIAALKKAQEDGLKIQTAYLQACNYAKKLEDRLNKANAVYTEFRTKYNKLVGVIKKAKSRQ